MLGAAGGSAACVRRAGAGVPWPSGAAAAGTRAHSFGLSSLVRIRAQHVGVDDDEGRVVGAPIGDERLGTLERARRAGRAVLAGAGQLEP
eukprot:scaffold12243_cov116-Isochrysis_galbana.AAC.8